MSKNWKKPSLQITKLPQNLLFSLLFCVSVNSNEMEKKPPWGTQGRNQIVTFRKLWVGRSRNVITNGFFLGSSVSKYCDVMKKLHEFYVEWPCTSWQQSIKLVMEEVKALIYGKLTLEFDRSRNWWNFVTCLATQNSIGKIKSWHFFLKISS